MPDGKVHNYIFKGNKNEHFTDMSNTWRMMQPSYSNGAAYTNLNNDGKLDLVVNNINAEASIYRNNTAGNQHFLNLSFRGNNLNTRASTAKLTCLTKARCNTNS